MLSGSPARKPFHSSHAAESYGTGLRVTVMSYTLRYFSSDCRYIFTVYSPADPEAGPVMISSCPVPSSVSAICTRHPSGQLQKASATSSENVTGKWSSSPRQMTVPSSVYPPISISRISSTGISSSLPSASMMSSFPAAWS